MRVLDHHNGRIHHRAHRDRYTPQAHQVWGKAGRANSATDPAPIEMFETVINLKPESDWRAGMTMDKLIAEMDKALQFPGISNAWTMPIKARLDMLATGIRTPIGIKVFGLQVCTGLAAGVDRHGQVLDLAPGDRRLGGHIKVKSGNHGQHNHQHNTPVATPAASGP